MGQFDNPNNEFNSDTYKVQPVTVVDEKSSSEYYIGISNNGKGMDEPVWQIKRIVKSGNVWDLSQYPNDDQSFSFVWNDRLSYTYE